jgi:hypothetical protein
MNSIYDIKSSFNPDSNIVVCKGDTLKQLSALPDNAFIPVLILGIDA